MGPTTRAFNFSIEHVLSDPEGPTHCASSECGLVLVLLKNITDNQPNRHLLTYLAGCPSSAGPWTGEPLAHWNGIQGKSTFNHQHHKGVFHRGRNTALFPFYVILLAIQVESCRRREENERLWENLQHIQACLPAGRVPKSLITFHFCSSHWVVFGQPKPTAGRQVQNEHRNEPWN